MIRGMQWIFLAAFLFLIVPEMALAQEQAPRGQQVQSADQSEQYTDIDQQIKLEKSRYETSMKMTEARNKEERWEITVAVIAFSIGVVAVIAIIALFVFAHVRKAKRRHELIGQYLEKGREVPRELLSGKITGAVLSPDQWASFIRWRDLRRGTWLLCLGVGLGLAIYFWSGNFRYTVWCLIILFLSAAFYINALFFSGRSDFNRKRESDA